MAYVKGTGAGQVAPDQLPPHEHVDSKYAKAETGSRALRRSMRRTAAKGARKGLRMATTRPYTAAQLHAQSEDARRRQLLALADQYGIPAEKRKSWRTMAAAIECAQRGEVRNEVEFWESVYAEDGAA